MIYLYSSIEYIEKKKKEESSIISGEDIWCLTSVIDSYKNYKKLLYSFAFPDFSGHSKALGIYSF